MLRRHFVSVVLWGLAAVTFAQNSLVWKAEEKFEEQKYSEALALLEEAIANPKTTRLALAYNLAAKSYAQTFNPELMKAAQGQPFDTMLFVTSVDKAITYFTKSFEHDMMPNEKGKVKAEFEAENRSMIAASLSYYNYAAQFLFRNNDLDGAVEMFTKYLDMPRNPVFSEAQTDSIIKANQEAYNQTAFNIAMIRYQQKNWDDVLKYTDMVLEDTAYQHDAYVMKMQAFLEKKDTAQWVECAKDAVMRLEDASSTAQTLIYYYVSKNLNAEAQEMANKMVADYPDNKNAWYIKGCVDLNVLHEYEASRADFAKTLAIDPNHYEANMNYGISFVNEVISRRDKGEYVTDKSRVKEFNESIEKMREFYRQSLPYFEKARELAPDRIREWGPNLQNVYQNLLMEDKANEVKALLEAGN